MSDDTEKCRQQIKRAIEQMGPFTHNMIGLALSLLASKQGQDSANQLIDEYGLEAFGIRKCFGDEEEAPSPILPEEQGE